MKPAAYILLSLFFLPWNQCWAAEAECASLVDSRCQGCHYKSRICQKLGKKSKSKWKRSIKNMVRYGAKLDKREQKALIKCLYKAKPGTEYICKTK